MGGLLHLPQQGGAGQAVTPQSPPSCTSCSIPPSTASVPTSYYYIILYSYYIIIVALWLPGPVKWLTKQCAFTVKAFAIKYSIQTTNSIM